MSNGYYLLARLTNAEKLLPAARLLTETKGVANWDAVEGHLHLVVRTDDNVQASVVRIRSIDDTAQVKTARLLIDDPRAAQSYNGTLRAYALVETDPKHKEAVYHAVNQLPETLFCVITDGPCDIVAVITGDSLSAIDRVIEDRIRSLDGVLRVKHHRVINLEQI